MLAELGTSALRSGYRMRSRKWWIQIASRKPRSEHGRPDGARGGILCSVGVIMGLIVAVLAGLKLWFMKQRSVFAFWFTVSKQIRTSRSMPAA
ncbi:hypothetical protein Nham_3875 [Nitrobacter hamburgensis X14]|uniref:Uncharacterized protein n=1 Tax=Nitrobacter hamburgensis (strain DSM 10229 / NCIMB 13809 / X14) TaxID=323097 RepID=Q1QGS4_NITHX|nr:hypothetical protein Nham_3875 [Nitrobacter hamburgensis X14]